MRCLRLVLLGLGVVSVCWMMPSAPVRAQAATVNWIWFDDGDPARNAPPETRYFRVAFNMRRTADEAVLEITADNQFTVWVNGTKVGSGEEWQRVHKFDVKKHLGDGKNVLAVQAHNTEGPAGLLVRLNYLPNGQSRQTIVSDDSWKSSKSAGEGWQKIDFDDSKWTKVKVIGPVGQAGPWRELAWGGAKAGKGPNDRFVVPEGFRVEPYVKIPESDERFSLVNMCFDAKGRLLVSREGGPILLCTNPNKEGVLQDVKPYCEQVKNCQGMCWIKDSLYLVGNGAQGTGLYRARDKDNDDKTDEVTLLHRFQGGMGEHGPHAIIHGPDDWLYLVIGNHAWAQIGGEVAKTGPNPEKLAANSPLLRWPTGRPGPDQGNIDTAEDVLLPRLNDANGHAANILAPGGTIWRLDHDGKNMSLFGAGYRNQFDAAFSPAGELFTFDSDMEWDEALPWYRHVRVTHVTPGSDYVWRTGAANTPNYYIDGLPPLVETGRGSPVGVEFYDHVAFPPKYRGAFFICDWSLGIIYAIHMERDGGSYKAKAEKFCTGNPLNVTDCAVAPDGSLVFTMGGRNTQGGVYRIVSTTRNEAKDMDSVQPYAAWSRARTQKSLDEAIKKDGKEKVIAQLVGQILPKEGAVAAGRDRLRLLEMMQLHGLPPSADLLQTLAKDKDVDMRARAIYLLGVNAPKESKETLVKALWDDDPLVRRRACEALIRAGIEPPIDKVWPLLADKDQFVRTAARLVVQRIDPKKWTDRLWAEKNEHLGFEGIVALCKINQAEPYAKEIFEKLHAGPPHDDVPALLNYLRTVQLALVHTTERPGSVRGLALDCLELFPHKDKFVNRELAILLTHFRTAGILDDKVQDKLLKEMLREKDDRPQQIHYFYCLRLLNKDAWTAEEKNDLLAWYDATKTWQGGNSYTPFLFNILRDLSPIFTAEDRLKVIAKGEEKPWAAVALLRLAPPAEVPRPTLLAELFERLAKASTQPRGNELKTFIVEALGKSTQQPEAQDALRKIADKDPSQREVVARSLARFPNAENFPYVVRGLESANKVIAIELISALQKNPARPKVDPMDPIPGPWRAALLASGKLDEKDRWKVVQLLRHWSNNRQFGGEQGDWKTELTAWTRWFGQNFPKEPALPNVVAEKPTESKYQYAELLSFIDSPAGRKGDVAKGRIVFEKAQCMKCHRYGKEGEGIGPDLTTLSKRFKRADVLESLYYPSKVISDQYRSSVIVTKSGQQVVGLAAPQDDLVTVLLNDATKVTLKKSEIDQQFASLISVMPEKLLDTLTKEEIADLLAFLESEPK